jgi:hypothetical protein
LNGWNSADAISGSDTGDPGKILPTEPFGEIAEHADWPSELSPAERWAEHRRVTAERDVAPAPTVSALGLPAEDFDRMSPADRFDHLRNQQRGER